MIKRQECLSQLKACPACNSRGLSLAIGITQDLDNAKPLAQSLQKATHHQFGGPKQSPPLPLPHVQEPCGPAMCQTWGDAKGWETAVGCHMP